MTLFLNWSRDQDSYYERIRSCTVFFAAAELSRAVDRWKKIQDRITKMRRKALYNKVGLLRDDAGATAN